MEELDLKEIFNIFWSRKIQIIIIVLIFVVIGAIYSYKFVTPEYKSATTLVLATADNKKKSDEKKSDSEAITQTDLTLNSNLVSTYSELIKSKTILREVLNNLDLNSIDENELRDDISVTAVDDTEIIEIAVASKSPSYASRIANEIAKVFSDKVAEIYNIDNVQVVDKAEKSTIPYNINHLRDLIIFAFVGLIVAIIKALLSNLLDNTIKNEEDIEKATGLLVLAQVPDFEIETNIRKGGLR